MEQISSSAFGLFFAIKERNDSFEGELVSIESKLTLSLGVVLYTFNAYV